MEELMVSVPLVRYNDEAIFLHPTKVTVLFQAGLSPQVELVHQDESITKHELLSLNYMSSDMKGKNYRVPILFLSR